jgi:hypothetical protein
MRYNELKWSHLAEVLRRLKQGRTTAQATTGAGFTPNVWARVRKTWDLLPAHLAEVDPTGTPADLEEIAFCIKRNQGQGGRPIGSRNVYSGARQGAQVALPTLIVSGGGFYVEDGRIVLEDE